MKKLLCTVLALGMAMSMAACGAAPAASSAAASSDAASSEATEAAAEESDLEYILGNGKMVIGYTVYEPMNYTNEDGEFVGFDTDLAKAVCAELGVEPEFVEINWDTKETELAAKSIDCIWNGLTVTEERKENMAFSQSTSDRPPYPSICQRGSMTALVPAPPCALMTCSR